MSILSRNLLIFVAAISVASCKNGSVFKKKPDQSDATGWNYNDKNQGGFYVFKAKDIKTGPGLVFVQGGTFTMGSTQEDVMSDWNNIPRRVTVNSFFIDKTEVANVHYREYLHWLSSVFSDPQYETIIYGKGALFYDALRQALGNRRFNRFLQQYLQTHMYQIINTEKWVADLNALNTPELQVLYESWVKRPPVLPPSTATPAAQANTP